MLPARRVNKKGVASERVKTIRSIVREVTGFAPYERRAMELIRNSKVRSTSSRMTLPMCRAERPWFA